MCVQKEEASGELVVKTIEEFREERTLWVVCRRQTRELSPICQAFMKLIKSEFRALSHISGTEM